MKNLYINVWTVMKLITANVLLIAHFGKEWWPGPKLSALAFRNSPDLAFYRIPKARRFLSSCFGSTAKKSSVKLIWRCIFPVFREIKLPQAHLPSVSHLQVFSFNSTFHFVILSCFNPGKTFHFAFSHVCLPFASPQIVHKCVRA